MTGTLVRTGGCAVLAVLSAAASCTAHRAGKAWPLPAPAGLDLYMPAPEAAAITPALIVLGQHLFHEQRLSADGSMSCASCHRPDRAFSDTVAQPAGVYGRTGRNTPSLRNVGYASSFAWDGRSTSIEEHVLHAISSPGELALPLHEVAGRLDAVPGYRDAFRQAFGGRRSRRDGGASARGDARPDGAPDDAHITSDRVALALGAYIRTLRSGDAPVDRFRAGDIAALGANARAGLVLFLGRGNCAACHAGPLLRDGRFRNTGVGWGGPDAGRALVTGRPEDRGRFATPSLRDVACTSPYMHDGSMATLEEVIDFYDAGGGANPYLDGEITPLHLQPYEKEALLAFLETLTGAGGCAH